MLIQHTKIQISSSPFWISIKSGKIVNHKEVSKNTTFWCSTPCDILVAGFKTQKKLQCFDMAQLVYISTILPVGSFYS
jgi:hypothetical protein